MKTLKIGELAGMSLEKFQVKIGEMACSFCTETIRKGLGRTDGVAEVHVSLAHEEALIAYHPERITPTTLTDTLRSLGYTVRDPKKVRTFEEEEAELLGPGLIDPDPLRQEA